MDNVNAKGKKTAWHPSQQHKLADIDPGPRTLKVWKIPADGSIGLDMVLLKIPAPRCPSTCNLRGSSSGWFISQLHSQQHPYLDRVKAIGHSVLVRGPLEVFDLADAVDI